MLVERILFSSFISSPLVSTLLVILVFIGLLIATWKLRLMYLRYVFITKKNRWILLEIKLPGEIRKTPEAMEQFLINGLWWAKGGGTNVYKKYWLGETLLTFSLELVSIGGTIHFFIQTPAHLKDLVQTQLYAQYPQIEINEAVDYTDRIPFKIDRKSSSAMFAWDYKLAKENALPIKTYRQYNFDKAVESLDSDQQIDPLVPLLEKISAIDPWEEIWVQYVVRAKVTDEWREEGERLIQDLLDKKRKLSTPDEEDDGRTLVSLTRGETDYITAIENNTDLFAFEVGIRSVYISHKASMFKSSRVSYLQHLFTSFNTKSYNAIKINNATGYDNPWEDYDEFLENTLKARALEKYRAREFFGEKPITRTIVDSFLALIGNVTPKTMVLTSEELATLFHLPGGTYQSTSLERTDTRKAQPPTNLPIA